MTEKTIKQQISECETVGEKNKILSGADLSRADLSMAILSRANLSWANLSWANLSMANLSWANLSMANLSRANLSGANLSRADLSGANLSGADLSRADLSGADLSGADLFGANLCICGKWSCSYDKTSIKIGCKTRTLEQWDSFFAGCEEFETQRGTFDFFEIEHNYRWFRELMKKYPAEFGVEHE